jgi:hypothetical protein
MQETKKGLTARKIINDVWSCHVWFGPFHISHYISSPVILTWPHATGRESLHCTVPWTSTYSLWCLLWSHLGLLWRRTGVQTTQMIPAVCSAPFCWWMLISWVFWIVGVWPLASMGYRQFGGSWTTWSWRWRRCPPLKRLFLYASRYPVTKQRAWIFIKIAVRTPNLALYSRSSTTFGPAIMA